MFLTAAAAASTAKLLQPLINDIYQGAKKIGAIGLIRWEARNFPLKLARRIRSLEEVRTLWKPEGGASLLDFYHPPKITIGDKKPALIYRLSEIGTENAVIEGIVGQGKSILLRSLAIQEILSNSATRIPIFFELRTLSAKLGFMQALYMQIEAYDIDTDEQTINYLMGSGKVSILLDGFDEIEDDLVKDTLREIEQLAQKYPTLQIVITSRPGNEIQKSPTFKRISIAPLTPAEYAAFLDKLKVSTEKSQAIRHAIQTNPSKVSELITTPLMLTLVVIVYEAEAEIPETLPEFFDRLFQIVFSRHDRMKAAFSRQHYSGLSERRLQMLFEAFCFMCLQEKFNRTLTNAQFNKAFDLALSYTDDCNCEVENFRKDIIKVACFMLEEGIDNVTFLHKSILEYYAASFIQKLSEENAALFYAAAVSDSRTWEEVLNFLEIIDSYKYCRDYVLPVVEQHRNTIINPLMAATSDSEYAEVLEKIIPGAGAYFRLSLDKPHTVISNGHGPIVSITGSNVGRPEFLFLDGIPNIFPAEIDETEFQELLGPADLNSQDSRVHIPIGRIITRFGSGPMRVQMDIFDTRLEIARRKAIAIIASQDKKKSIFLPKAK